MMKPTNRYSAQCRPHISLRLERARAFIEGNFNRPITLADIAANAFMSSAHFLRQFKRQYCLTPHQYLIQYRLQVAQAMLKRTDAAIADVVSASGFGNRSAFSRLFKARCGLSPSEFRRYHTQRGSNRDQVAAAAVHTYTGLSSV